MNPALRMFALVATMFFLLSGCVRYISPLPGYLASEESRIALPEKGTDSVFKSEDLQLNYQLARVSKGLEIKGTLSLLPSLTYTYPNVKTFFLKLSLLDENGHVLEVVDITPFYKYLGRAPETMPISKVVDAVPPATEAVALSYYGVFQGEKPNISDKWIISYFPFSEMKI